MSDERQVRLSIHGRVQGVFFRASARDTAARVGVRGWVRNRPDGTVEAVASGPERSVEHFIDWCRSGPTAARVARLEVGPVEPEVDLPEGFEVRP